MARIIRIKKRVHYLKAPSAGGNQEQYRSIHPLVTKGRKAGADAANTKNQAKVAPTSTNKVTTPVVVHQGFNKSSPNDTDSHAEEFAVTEATRGAQG